MVDLQKKHSLNDLQTPTFGQSVCVLANLWMICGYFWEKNGITVLV